ncbi:MAG: hypothetical protein OQK09_16955 [Colwellia sp.]|nr:hypothetical protein [Colwellia sp.]MCW8866457.1 hypothetical protein [Colwellia sp.]MCW9083199.1 hypothetical protein [Colwellia sp.]
MRSKIISFINNLFTHSKALTTVTSTLLLITSFNSQAIETSIQLHKADQSGAYGISVGVGDNFFNQQAFNWSVSYNRLEDINITWNEDDINFALDTVDLMLSYRYYPKSYNSFVKSLIVEFQAGVGVAITENKFVWPELNEEKYFSEQGDVNAALGFLVHKKITKQMSVQIGVKHYPDYSEFGDISSVFLGLTYNFGRQKGY